jgi:hypothetical protein
MTAAIFIATLRGTGKCRTCVRVYHELEDRDE